MKFSERITILWIEKKVHWRELNNHTEKRLMMIDATNEYTQKECIALK